MRFVRIPSAEWVLSSPLVPDRRRQLLHGPDFVEIVDRLCRGVRVMGHKRARKGRTPYYRAEVLITVDASVVDLFHHSASGYRAQYYASTALGEGANEYAVTPLAYKVVGALRGRAKRTCPVDWLRASLTDDFAKLWIHQSMRLRVKRRSDRNLNFPTAPVGRRQARLSAGVGA